VAHIGYFRAEFVARRAWLDEAAYAELVGLCQFLPGPASSQVGFALGLSRAGWRGALAAWAGFTLPSAALLVLFAYGAAGLATSKTGAGILHGLKLVAVAIVAQAVWSMARSLCPDRTRAAIALAALVSVVFVPLMASNVIALGSLGQVLAIALGALAGWLFCCESGKSTLPPALAIGVTNWAGLACLGMFALLLVAAPLLPGLSLFNAFYRSGALVFGGGHVVLPLLRDAVVAPGWVSDSAFLAGYGATQAMPGPLFTFAAYLGTIIGSGAGGAMVALLAIFLPGLLLLVGVLPFWSMLRARPAAQAAVRGVNAAVVGLLGAALYDPVWLGAVLQPPDFVLVVAGFLLLTLWRTPPWMVVGLGAVAGVVL
jgi:chromate transporter